MYLVDTDVISELRKAEKANPGVRQFFDVADRDNAPLYLSAVTIGELRQGVEVIHVGLPSELLGSTEVVDGGTSLDAVLDSTTGENIMRSFGREYFAVGMAAGTAYVRARLEIEAEVKGWAWGLVRLLEKRFGPVSEALRARIYAADLASIQAWLDRAIEATEFNSVCDLS